MSFTSIVWFRNDLRLHDHEALDAAYENGPSIVPVYCIDPRWWDSTSFGFSKTGAFRTQFLLDALQDLRQRLQAKGSDLVIRFGKPEEILPELALDANAGAVYFHREYADEERKIEQAVIHALEDENIEWEGYWGGGLYHPDDMPISIRQVPDVYTQFRKKVEKYSDVRDLFPEPRGLRLPEGIEPGRMPMMESFGHQAPAKSERGVMEFVGGETAALERLEAYCGVEGPGPLKAYKHTRNGLLGADYSSKFSPWLAQGSLSPRMIYWTVKEYEQQVVKNQSTYWLIFELIWRDYFRYWGAKHGTRIFQWEGVMGAQYRISRNEEELFQLWAKGNTGIPFVDANMRELNETGFMSNRGRQNVASFLINDYKVDWRRGAEYFESLLIDYDVYSNWGNWCYVAGVGADPRPNRYFHILRQAERYDEKGHYVRHWLPELSGVPTKEVHTVFRLLPEQKELYGAQKYPQPALVPDEWNAFLAH